MTDEAASRAATLRPRVEELRRNAMTAERPPGFASSLQRAQVAVIAEVKRSSPSKGVINPDIDIARQVVAYTDGGAAAISILTQTSRFGGSNQDLGEARASTRLPLLKKDFHVDVAQLYEAKTLGASAALVIVRAIRPERFRELVQAARDIALEVLVEVRTEAELDLALREGAAIIGVNNRNLETLEIDPETSLRLLPMIPREIIAVAESGVRQPGDVARVAEAGADAVLVGSELSASADPEAAVRSLAGIQRSGGARKG